MFFFLLWPLFARAPHHWEIFLLSAPGVQSFFFLLRSVGRRDLSAGPEQKKKTPPRVFFFCSGPGERQGKEKPRWAPARGQSKKKTPPRVFFFLLRPRRKAREGEAPLGAGTGPEQKKKTPPRVFFFVSGPGERQGKEKPRWAPARGQSKKCFFFFALAPCRRPTGLLLPLPFAGAAAKKNTLGGVFFFAAAPRGRSLTHCGPGWRCLPLAGVVSFFCCGPARTGVVFFFWLWPRPDAHSLTVGWGDFGKARVVFFFLLRPRRVFLDNNKKCLGYYIGSKKTRRGHSKKKTPLPSGLLAQRLHIKGLQGFLFKAPLRDL